MRITLTDRLIARTASDGSAVPFAFSVWDDSSEPWVLQIPTTLQYRLDNPDTGYQVQDWASITAASTGTITATGAQETIRGDVARYKRRLTVRANAGLSTVTVASRDYWLQNNLALVS